MNSKSKDSNNFLNNLRTSYRMSIFETSNYKEIKSLNFSLLALLGLFFLMFVLFFMLFFFIFSFKPVKELVFGYDDVKSSSAFIELNKQVIELETALQSQNVYINGLTKMINGDSNTILESSPEVLQIEKKSIVKEPTIPQKTAKVANTDGKALRNKLRHLVSPVRGRISAGFNALEDHYGIGVIAPKNSPISAVADGMVINADWTIKTGNTISVQHPDNVISIYKHNSALLKKTGDLVKSGEAIAIIGNTGEQTTGPHLHFELWYKGQAVDPSEYVRF